MLIRLIRCLVFSAATAGYLSLAAEDSPAQTPPTADNGSSRTRTNQLINQAAIRALVRKLECESERDEAKRQLIAVGRDAAEELFRAVDSKQQPLADRAAETLQALPVADLRLHDAMDRAIGHVFVEFFELIPHSKQLRGKPFASEFTDVWGGFALPSPKKEQAIALRVHLRKYGATTITRLSPDDLREIRRERSRKQFQQLWLPVVPKDSEYAQRAVRGVVQDQSGKPIAGAEVHCRYVYSPKEVFNPTSLARMGPTRATQYFIARNLQR